LATDLPINEESPPEPRGIRFGLVDLLIAVGLIGAIFGWYRLMGIGGALFPGVAAAWAFIGWRLRPKAVVVWLPIPLICFGIAFLIAGVNGAHPNNNSARCINNLKQIGLALLTYHDREQRLPPGQLRDAEGRALHSWRSAVLRDLDLGDIHKQFKWDEPWDSPTNRKLESTTKIYRCPAESDEVPTTWTNYLAIVGTPKVWPDRGSGKTRRASQSSILVIESANTGIHWMEPRDLHVTQMAPWLNAKSGQGPSSRHGAGVNVIFTDGRVDTLSPDTDPAVLRAMLNGE
jgi:prepilin-type processing-associated H-X9-DG protein